MEYFLERIAKSFHSEFRDKSAEHCIVFPNRRAGLFFIKYLAAELGKPVWSPSVMTINDLFRTFSKLRPAENEMLLFELYKIYRSLNKRAESFDEFYYWGDMLLNDFDDADKYLVDAEKLFKNVSDLKKIDQQFGGLTDEQAEIIKRFWTNFNPARMTDEKTKFITIWSILSNLYKDFRNTLIGKNIAYEGMIFRDVIENRTWPKVSDSKWRIFHFVGFNALNECEKRLMKELKEEGRARFYWDYDNSYIQPGQLNSAGYFLRDNISIFGNDMPDDWSYDTFISKYPGKAMRQVIETSSDVAQVKLIPELIRKIPGIGPDNAHETAVVLADENLLMPVLTSLPPEIPDVNITMGYPMRQTTVFSLVEHLLELQRNSRISNGITLFWYIDVLRILKNSLISGMPDQHDKGIIREINEKNLLMVPEHTFNGKGIIESIFKKVTTPALLSDYVREIFSMIVTGESSVITENSTDLLPVSIRNEFIYRVVLAINRIDNVIGNSDISFTADTWGRILKRLLWMQSVPFSGEPLSGIQVMGILETRALDFKNLIIVSVNEGLLPSVTASSSFIPFSLREAFGLPSVNHQESIYAYHFYRLLHRAENVTFIYNSNSEGLRSGEISRFLQQMKYDAALKPVFKNLSFEICNPSAIGTLIERTAAHNSRLQERFSSVDDSKRLSPSAINIWLNCRMKFYYRYVNDLKEPEKISGEIDPAMLGTLLHEVMKDIYSGFVGKMIDTALLDSISKDKDRLSRLIVKAINTQFSRKNESVVAINEFIVRNVLLTYISRILELDSKAAPFRIVALEEPVKFRMSVNSDPVRFEIWTGGIIDRVDIKEGVTRIVDYKTGKVSDSIKEISELFREDRAKDTDGWLQTLLYCEGYLSLNPGAKVRPSIYKVKSIPGEEANDHLLIKPVGQDEIAVDDYNTVRQEYLQSLQSAAGIILGSNEPFIMTNDLWGKCSYCPYRVLCKR
jgi:CRISPR/Cas system-associated exonuclease Cas4 (RecB family)